MKLFKHQEEISKKANKLLNERGIAYLIAEERTGKTFTALNSFALFLKGDFNHKFNLLVLAKKGEPLESWKKQIEEFKSISKPFNKYVDVTVTNYHQAKNVPVKRYSFIILDECHNYIAGYPKPSKLFTVIKNLTWRKNQLIIFSSATPCTKSYSSLFHQMQLSYYSPFSKYKNFYKWFIDFGIPKFVRVAGGREVKQYDKVKENKVKPILDSLSFKLKRSETKMFDHEPTDKLHYVYLKEETKERYNQILNHNNASLVTSDREIIEMKSDNLSKKLSTLHQLEGGTYVETSIKAKDLRTSDGQIIKQNSTPRAEYELINNEKINYIKSQWGDTEDLAIFYYYRAEYDKLKLHFKKARILHSITHSEGIDLYKYETVVVYSMGYRMANYVQMRARQASHKRKTPIVVHFLLVRGAMSSGVYYAVAKKKRKFIDKLYNQKEL